MAWAAIGGAAVATVGGALLNDGGGGTSTQTNDPWGPYQGYLKDSAKRLEQLTGSKDYYGGDMVANLTPDQMTSMGMMTGAADQIGGYNQNLMGAMGGYMSPDFMDPNKNPYQQQYVDAAIRPITQAYTEQGLPSIRSGARMTGGADYGSTRQGVAEGIMGRGYLDTVGDVTSRINTDLYGKNIDAQQRAMSMSPMMAQMMGVPASMYGAAGAAQQAQNQAEIGADVNKFNWEQGNEEEDLYRFMQMLQSGSGGTSTTNTPDGGGANMMNIIGGAQLGTSLYNNWNSGSGAAPYDAWDSSYNSDFRDPYELDW